MQILEAYKPFEIQEIKLHEWYQRPVKNNFFELVLIKKGQGMQCINYNEYEYRDGSLFLLPPLKCHSFQISEPTRFIFLKFTSEFFQAESESGFNQSEWFREAAYILSNYNQLPGDIIHNEVDRQHIHSLFELILRENQNYGPGSVVLIRSLMTGVLEILLRNIKQCGFYELEAVSGHDPKIHQILSYINAHIHQPEVLKVGNLARTFHLSPPYVSEYFRKKVQMPLREYIIKARLKLVEIRLLNSNYTLTEIADELGYTDVSHLSRTFKKYTGVSVRTFKQEGEYRLLKRSAC